MEKGHKFLPKKRVPFIYKIDHKPLPLVKEEEQVKPTEIVAPPDENIFLDRIILIRNSRRKIPASNRLIKKLPVPPLPSPMQPAATEMSEENSKPCPVQSEEIFRIRTIKKHQFYRTRHTKRRSRVVLKQNQGKLHCQSHKPKKEVITLPHDTTVVGKQFIRVVRPAKKMRRQLARKTRNFSLQQGKWLLDTSGELSFFPTYEESILINWKESRSEQKFFFHQSNEEIPHTDDDAPTTIEQATWGINLAEKAIKKAFGMICNERGEHEE